MNTLNEHQQPTSAPQSVGESFQYIPVLKVQQSPPLRGTVSLTGAKNAVLCSMASLIMVDGISTLTNVPHSADVLTMSDVLRELGAVVHFDPHEHVLTVDTSNLSSWRVSPEAMKKMRASVLVMGPLLSRFGRAEIALPGGCLIGARPIDYHLRNFMHMGVQFVQEEEYLLCSVDQLQSKRLVLEYPSVGATENLMMAATAVKGTTSIINAALEPEVLDLIALLRAMGAHINIEPPATIRVEGGHKLEPIEHVVMADRLEAGSLLLATAITGGEIYLPDAQPDLLDLFLYKLEQMGHTIVVPEQGGIQLWATTEPKAVSFKTGPYPGFPTDLQGPMMAAQCVARGSSVIQETVFENRLLHVRELRKLGAQITVDGDKAVVKGVDELFGAPVIATDIRASCALVLAGLVAQGSTMVAGLQHWRRGYEELECKLQSLGALIGLKDPQLDQ